MKGILLVGGTGSRLYPITSVASKQLMTIYDKPMFYYPLSTLMMAGIKDILVISTPHDIPIYQRLMGDGSHLGINITYKVQERPEGIAQAFILAEDFIGQDSVALILGDNIFYGHGLSEVVKGAANLTEGALIFGYWVKDPERYGVVEFDEHHRVIGIEEKPKVPKSNYAVPGLYFYDNQVVNIAKNLKPSARGELEITDVNLHYLKRNNLKVELMGRGYAWLDTGTPASLLDAANYVATIERRQGLKISCIEEVAYRMGFITIDQLAGLIEKMPKSDYRQYINDFWQDEDRKLARIIKVG